MVRRDTLSTMGDVSRKLHAPYATNIDFKGTHLLILDQPDVKYMDKFIEECKKNNVNDLVCVCEPQYDKSILQNQGIRVWDWEFDDGSTPPEETIELWFNLLRDRFKESPETCVAIHCKAGLGRAPILVCLALIELGMNYDEAIEFIRERRKGALNARQIEFLKDYRPRRRLKLRKSRKGRDLVDESTSEKCVIL